MITSDLKRFTRALPCPICGGHDQLPRGDGARCYGFLSGDGRYAHCTRPEVAGSIELISDSNSYPHLLHGDCLCGVRHGTFGAERKSQRAGSDRLIVATYDYQDETGALLYQIVRYQPKDFVVRRPNGSGGWIWNRKGVRLVLYRLLLVLDAIREGWRIYVVEGEKDADSINHLGGDGQEGFVATCNPFGAGKWRPEYTEMLHGAKVCLMADKDADGARHLRKVEAAVRPVAASLLCFEPRHGKDVSDHLAAGGSLEDLVLVERAALQPPPDRATPGTTVDPSPEEDATGSSRGSKATRLVELALATCVVFHAPDGTGYVDIIIDGHRETWPLRSRAFSRWLARQFYEVEKTTPGAQVATDALAVLEGQAQFSGPEVPVHVRVALVDDVIYIDLANDDWEVVEITGSGWQIVAEAPVRFRRTRGMQPLPSPIRGGSIEELRPFLGTPSDLDFYLTVAWVLGALRGRGPFPIAVIQGEQGSGKSTRARLLRLLVDPSTVALRRLPRSERDLAISGHNAWVLAFDNLSAMSPQISDALCTVSTGGGLGTRELYTDSEEVLFEATRPVILNGIADLLDRPDLTDRAIPFYLPQIRDQERRDELLFWAQFEAARPRILGALFGAASTALRRLPQVQVSRAPRMADFARWCIAAEPALGWAPGSFLDAYNKSRGEAIEIGLECDEVAGAVRALVASIRSWEGTASDLLALLANQVSDKVSEGKDWPRAPRALADRLRRLAPSLRAVGVGIVMGHRERGTRKRLIRLTDEDPVSPQSCGPCGPCGPKAENTKENDPARDEADLVRTAGGTQGQSPEPAAGGPETAGTAETEAAPASLPTPCTVGPTRPTAGPEPDIESQGDASGRMEVFEL